MAESLAACLDLDPDSVGLLENTLQAAGELKAVRLKVLLGRCYEVISWAKESGGLPVLEEDFLNDVFNEAMK